jgi:hypothetical protein
VGCNTPLARDTSKLERSVVPFPGNLERLHKGKDSIAFGWKLAEALVCLVACCLSSVDLNALVVDRIKTLSSSNSKEHLILQDRKTS